MTKCAPVARFFLLLCLPVLFSVGCSNFKRSGGSEEKDPYFIQGQNRTRSMDYEGAIESFGRALQSNPTNASAHLELAVLYDHKKKDPAAAIYHYEQFLKLRTNAPLAGTYREQIISCKRALAKEVSYAIAPRDLQVDLERSIQTIAVLEEKVRTLQTELNRRPQYVTNYITNHVPVNMPTFDPRKSARLTQPVEIVQPSAQVEEPIPDLAEPEPQPRNTPPTAAQPQARPSIVQQSRATQNRQASPSPGQSPRAASNTQRREPAAQQSRTTARKTHTVRPGDTLDVVARRYGVSVSALKAANPSARNGARSGQQLVIPER